MLRSFSMTILALATALPTFAADAPTKHVWMVPVNVSQALNIRLETKATAELLDKAVNQCTDADCKAKAAECRKVMKTCVLVPSPASVHESEVENN